MNIISLFALLASAQTVQTVNFEKYFANMAIPEAQPSAAPSMVVKVKAEVKVMTQLGQQVESSVEVLQKKYGFVPDQTFTPQVIADDKQFTILPYPSEPRPIVYVVKGFVNQARLADLSGDQLVRRVEQDGASVEATAEQLHKFVQGYGHMLLTVKGVRGLSVGVEKGNVMPNRPVLVIALDPEVNRDEMAETLRKRVPALPLLPHRYEQAAAKPSEPRFRTQ